MSAPDSRPAPAASAAAAGGAPASGDSQQQQQPATSPHPYVGAGAAESQQQQQQPEQRASAVIAQLLPVDSSSGSVAAAAPVVASPAPSPAAAAIARIPSHISSPIPRNDSSQELQRSTWVGSSSSSSSASSSATQTSPSPSLPLPYSTPVPVSAADPHLIVRRACADDFAKGHLALLAQLTTVGHISPAAYVARIQAMHERYAELFHVLVIEDTSLPLLAAAQSTTPPPGGISDTSSSSTVAASASGSAAAPAPDGICSIIACATLLVELKLVHGCGAAGHVEDVVVKDGYRGKNLGVRIVQALHDIAIAKGCYKVMLDCSESNMRFYEKMGYKENSKHMRLDLI